MIHFVRHGQYEADPNSSDGPLTTLGRDQARRTATQLAELDIAQIYCSDFRRPRKPRKSLPHR